MDNRSNIIELLGYEVTKTDVPPTHDRESYSYYHMMGNGWVRPANKQEWEMFVLLCTPQKDWPDILERTSGAATI